jgi:hypothetical protein
MSIEEREIGHRQILANAEVLKHFFSVFQRGSRTALGTLSYIESAYIENQVTGAELAAWIDGNWIAHTYFDRRGFAKPKNAGRRVSKGEKGMARLKVRQANITRGITANENVSDACLEIAQRTAELQLAKV